MLTHFEGQEYKEPFELGEIGSETAYLISSTHVAKTFLGWHLWRATSKKNLESEVANLKHEYNITARAYECGLSVPKPEGVYLVNLVSPYNFLSMIKPKAVPAFVMEYLEGKPIDRLKEPVRKKAEQMLAAEIEKAIALGFTPGNDYDYPGNSLWNAREGKVYLLDFASWKAPTKPKN